MDDALALRLGCRNFLGTEIANLDLMNVHHNGLHMARRSHPLERSRRLGRAEAKASRSSIGISSYPPRRRHGKDCDQSDAIYIQDRIE